MAKQKDPPAAAEEGSSAPKASLLSTVIAKAVHKPPRIFLYGVHGIGKTTFAASAPKPILICTEEGAEELDVARFPRAESSEQVLDYLRTLYREPHEYQTVVIDTADWLEDMVQLELLERATKKELSYGQDAQLAMQRVNEVLIALNFLRDKRQMSTIIVAHSEIKRFDSPLTEPYDRYQPKLQRSLSALMQEWADAVLFATYDVSVKSEEVGFDKKVRRGISSGDRILYCEERPAFFAKNRYSMPSELPLDWEKVAECVPFFNQSAKG